ncbi:hypothetical protein [Streptomyces physcomitrii]|uniref:Uncharacterized protein n=1 Tax=Streptomyces physcomitrii TaxID=2724184 RepID=A0ABX1GYR3_9ACTN|nr:hypothetical protein [Streptomyces physcomitrii]NKI41226.1 hypothetical protein [Streptomyces physcomitrii]
MPDSSPLPPVRLRPAAELARDALATPLLSRAARLARWADGTTRVGAGGELIDEQLPAAAEELGFSAAADPDGDGPVHAAEAWRIALDCGLVEIADEEEGTVTAGDALASLASGSPDDVLHLWLTALEATLADASVPALEDLAGSVGEDGTLDLGSLDWDPESEADFLDGVLGNLYLMTVGEEGPAEESAVPLPVLAASMLVPEGMEQPSDEILEEVSEAMVRLDEQFQLIEPIGLVEFQPVDEALLAEDDGEELPAQVDESDISRYGMVRLTPLGLYGMRTRLAEAGIAAPLVGDLADKGADALLTGTSGYPQAAAQSEIEQWLGRRETLGAARELLAAARGGDEGAPLRRLRCQQALSLVDDSAEPALREVLGDPELGGLARVWLAEHGAADVPPPSESMIFWLTVDTLAAQLDAEGNSPELRSLVEGLAQQHSGFFDTVWRVDHPDTAKVLEAMGRLHPDKRVAKEARKAAFKARSQKGI